MAWLVGGLVGGAPQVKSLLRDMRRKIENYSMEREREREPVEGEASGVLDWIRCRTNRDRRVALHARSLHNVRYIVGSSST